MREAARILDEDAMGQVAPPVLTEPSSVLAPIEEGAMEVEPVPMCTWGDTATRGVEAKVVKLPGGPFVPAI
eukprot:11320871-Alexandrium_andersonii.AAC.1